jgi:hypothetical protein
MQGPPLLLFSRRRPPSAPAPVRPLCTCGRMLGSGWMFKSDEGLVPGLHRGNYTIGRFSYGWNPLKPARWCNRPDARRAPALHRSYACALHPLLFGALCVRLRGCVVCGNYVVCLPPLFCKQLHLVSLMRSLHSPSHAQFHGTRAARHLTVPPGAVGGTCSSHLRKARISLRRKETKVGWWEYKQQRSLCRITGGEGVGGGLLPRSANPTFAHGGRCNPGGPAQASRPPKHTRHHHHPLEHATLDAFACSCGCK